MSPMGLLFTVKSTNYLIKDISLSQMTLKLFYLQRLKIYQNN